jgi:MFS transporter, ACS family, solute carrier family 17 (sodium-dependent inorganic phosphate cotransporter), other
MAIVYGLKVNLSVAMVAMVNHTAVKSMNVHLMEDHTTTLSNTGSVVEECLAENTTTSGINQVSLCK